MNKKRNINSIIRLYGLFLVLCANVYAMHQEPTVRDLQEIYSRSVDGLLDLLDGRELSEGVDPYAGFHVILRAHGDDARQLQAAAAHKLGCMCTCCLGVPEKEYGPEGAQRYFTLGARYGHSASLEELARCACRTEHYGKAFVAWRQQRFLEIGALCKKKNASPELLEEIESALNFIPSLPGKVKQSAYYKDALDAIRARLDLAANSGCLQSSCLLARSYEVAHDKRAISYVHEFLVPKLLEKDVEEVCQLIQKTQAQQALQVAIDAGDLQAAMLLGFVLFYERNYKQSYFLLKKVSQEGIDKACIYRMLMDINGLGTKRSFTYAYTKIQEWSKSKKGRELIALLASLVDQETLENLVKAKSNDEARFVLGVILYSQGSDKRAYDCLHSFTKGRTNFYACYCCAKILEKNPTHSSDELVTLYTQLLALPDIEEELHLECLKNLYERALAGNATGIGAICRMGLDEAFPFDDIIAVLDVLKRKTKKEQSACIRSLYSSGYVPALRKARERGNRRASLMLAMLFDVEVGITQQQTKKSILMKDALVCLKESQGQILSEKDLASFALHLGLTCKQEDLLEIAFSCVEYAAQLGLSDAKRELGYLMFLKKDLGQQEMKEALARIEESALQGNVDDLRLLAQLYRYNAKLESAHQCSLDADVEKSYRFASMLLERVPDDKVASRIVGCFLFMNGGREGVPAGQEERAYTLLSHGLVEPVSDVLSTDYYVMGCLCLRKGDIEQAKFWFNKDSKFSLCACAIAVIDFIESSSDKRGQVYDGIEKALSDARKYQAQDREHFFELVLNKKFLELLKTEILAGNTRARVLMARIVVLTHDKDLGVTQEQFLDYLITAAEGKCSSGLSFLGFLFNHGTDVEKSESKALKYLIEAMKSMPVPQHILKETLEELVVMASQSEITKEHIIAAYYAASLLIRSDIPENIHQALYLVNKAEADRVDKFSHDVSLASCVHESGAWSGMERLADRGHSEAAAVLGLSYGLRYIENIIDFEEFVSEGCKRLEQALRNGSKVLTPRELSKKYMLSVKKRLLGHPGSYDDIRKLIERAHQLDPDNQDITYTLASFYRQKLFSGIPMKESIQKGIDLLEGLADKGHEIAALEVGLGYLAIKYIDEPFKSYAKALHYLFLAASKGNRRALLVLVCSLGKETNKYTKLVARQVFKYIDEHVAKPEVSQELKNYLLGLKAVLNQQWDTASSYFDQLAEGLHPDVMVEVAMLYFHIKNDVQKAVSLTVKAIDIAGKQNLDLFQINIGQLIQSFVAELEMKACYDDTIKRLLGCIRMKLQQYKYTL